MNFLKPIIDTDSLPKLWQLAENYLNVGQSHVYKVSKIDANDLKFKLARDKRTKSRISTILKVISYATIIPLLCALSLRLFYRKLAYRCVVLPTLSCNPSITRFGAAEVSEKFREKVENLKTIHIETQAMYDEKDLFLLHTEFKRENVKDLPHLLERLKTHLASATAYRNNDKAVLEIVYIALRSILENPKSNLSFAKSVYKLTTRMFRENDVERGKIYFDIYFLLQMLRKKIKLQKHLKIKVLLEQTKVYEKYTKDEVARAEKWLGLNWLHGTKAYTIESACKNTDKNILPSGLLKKAGVQMLTGEMAEGACSEGVNQTSLSGVNLLTAGGAIQYAQGFSFSVKNEESSVEVILNSTFNEAKSFFDTYARYTRIVEGLRRVKRLNPEYFNANRDALKTKLLVIYHQFDALILSKPLKLETKDMSSLIIFLNAMEDFECILTESNPSEAATVDPKMFALANIPVVLGSTNIFSISINTVREERHEVEMLCPKGLKLGTDVKVIFTEDENRSKVEELLKIHGLDTTIEIESMKILKIASRLDRIFENYFYSLLKSNEKFCPKTIEV